MVSSLPIAVSYFKPICDTSDKSSHALADLIYTLVGLFKKKKKV